MPLHTQIIDVRKSYLPIAPETLHRNLLSTQGEDGHEKTIPVSPYDGYNFLPTPHGYQSFFGTATKVNLSALSSRVQYCIQFPGASFYIAFAEDGLWLSTSSAWERVRTHTTTDFARWTWAFLEDACYAYQAGQPRIYKIDKARNVFDLTPTFLNMAAQQGLFKADIRLGMWDSSNSISWSSALDFADFTPSLETFAGNAIFDSIIGKIVSIVDHGQGFIIYATGSIVGVLPHEQPEHVWKALRISSRHGINFPYSVCQGTQASEHYVYSSEGILRIGALSPTTNQYEKEVVFPELWDLLKEHRKPVMLHFLKKRYLCFSVYDERYISGQAAYAKNDIDPSLTSVLLSQGYWNGDIAVLPEIIDGDLLQRLIEHILSQGGPGVDEDCI